MYNPYNNTVSMLLVLNRLNQWNHVADAISRRQICFCRFGIDWKTCGVSIRNWVACLPAATLVQVNNHAIREINVVRCSTCTGLPPRCLTYKLANSYQRPSSRE